jgi:hypothetical protein
MLKSSNVANSERRHPRRLQPFARAICRVFAIGTSNDGLTQEKKFQPGFYRIIRANLKTLQAPSLVLPFKP